ncbi:MAG: luxA 1 [Devosia sp.]|uniref:LLM class flavin-dependent oxidoreductase n=1 Tax=Devosia sp. TaxID=1871048 RepID=UPI002605ABD8|nr:LLM class flavin-dependent oxidoreductase [Devosia sp.]MDB5529850.1 luxA 1 [Devosia sp.]
MELGIYSFGDVQRDPKTGQLGSTAEATRNLFEAIKLADEVGLDYFGIGEHHTREMPASAAPVILAAAAAVTKNIRLGSAVTVLSTDDPVRIFQQFATLSALSNGRAEITAGRGSSTESFPLFGYSLNDYDELYAEKLDLLLAINEATDTVTWSGKHRSALDNALIVPRPDAGSLPIWLGTGGNPQSSVRAALLGLPISYAIIGGQAARFAPLADLYRRAAAQAQVPGATIKVSVASPGFIGEDSAAAKALWYGHWHEIMTTVGKIRGFAAPDRQHFEHEASAGGALFVGSPEEIAERIVALHHRLGHTRQFFQMDLGQLPQKHFLRAIELLGTRVKPLVDAQLATDQNKETADA